MKLTDIFETNGSKHPTHFNSGDEFYHYIHYGMGLKNPYCEHQGGGAWVAYDGDTFIATYDENSGIVDFEDIEY